MDNLSITHIVLQQHQSSSSYTEQEAVATCHIGVGALRHLRTLGLVKGQEIGGKMCYSEEEIIQLRRIRRLQRDLGVNLAGVEVILHLLDRLEAIHQELAQERKSHEH